jgi:plastocyanin
MAMRRREVNRAACAAALAAAGAAGLTRAQGQVVVVEIRDYKYLPALVSIKPGTTVRWVNQEKRTTHTVRFLGPDGIESERLFPGESWERRFDKPGTHPYVCGPHPEMKGSVEVDG